MHKFDLSVPHDFCCGGAIYSCLKYWRPFFLVVIVWWWWWWWLSTCIAHYAERLYCATCSGALWKGMSSVLIEKIRCWVISRRWSGSRFQTIGPATENARRPNLLRRWSGTISRWRVADRRRWRLAMSDVGMQQSIKYCGAMPCKHRWIILQPIFFNQPSTFSNLLSFLFYQFYFMHTTNCVAIVVCIF